MKVRFYTTAGCHLCEQARAQLSALQARGLALDVEPVDIADSTALTERYGISIPVIATDNRELAWPFTPDDLHAFLQARGR